MNQSHYIHREVSDDGERMYIEFLDGPSLCLTRTQAIAIREVIVEQLPNMGCSIATDKSTTQ